jgi:hypothetical protein
MMVRLGVVRDPSDDGKRHRKLQESLFYDRKESHHQTKDTNHSIPSQDDTKQDSRRS